MVQRNDTVGKEERCTMHPRISCIDTLQRSVPCIRKTLKQYVEPGACVAQLKSGTTVLTACALEPRFCPTTYGIAGQQSKTFVSSHQLHQGGSATPGYSCLSSDGLDARHYVHVGRCASKVDNYICTSVAENCKNVREFEVSAELCTLLADLSPDRKAEDRALFTSCYEAAEDGDDLEYRCFWSGADCSAEHGMKDFGARPYSYFLECEYEETEVGACKATNQEGEDAYYCAVSAQSCDDPSNFVGVHDLRNNVGIDCRLCKTPSAIPDPIATANPVRGSTPASTSSGSAGSSNSDLAMDTNSFAGNGSNTNNRNVIIAATVGACVGGLILTVLAVWISRRIAGRRNVNTKKGGTAIVVELAEETASHANTNDESHEGTSNAGSQRGTGGGGGGGVHSSEYL